MQVDQIKESEYQEVLGWFTEKRGWPYPPENWVLPETSFVARYKGKMMAACWLYVTNSPIGFIEILVTNPNASTLIAGRALHAAVKAAIDYNKKLRGRYSRVMAVTANESLQRLFKKQFKFRESKDRVYFGGE